MWGRLNVKQGGKAGAGVRLLHYYSNILYGADKSVFEPHAKLWWSFHWIIIIYRTVKFILDSSYFYLSKTFN